MPKITRLRRGEFFPDARTQVVVMDRFHQAEMRMHRHEFAELVIILSGTALHSTGRVRHRLQAGDILFINSSRSHAYEETHGLTLVNILIREDVFQEAEYELGSLPGYHALFTLEPVRWRHREFMSHLRLNAADLRQVTAWVDALKEETERPLEGGRLLARSWLLLIVGLLARRYGRNAGDSPQLEMRLGRVLSWIDQNSHQPICVGELAVRAAMSERTFLRRFREATGVSPVDYLLRARIRRAIELLDRRAVKLSISEVASRCGFEDSNYFARQFYNRFGKRPTEFL